jgi:hypothetical protein
LKDAFEKIPRENFLTSGTKQVIGIINGAIAADDRHGLAILACFCLDSLHIPRDLPKNLLTSQDSVGILYANKGI